MTEVKVKLNSIEAVKDFNHTCTLQDLDIDVVSGRYVLDAKSLMGLFSLDLSKELTIKTYAETEEQLRIEDKFTREIAKYLVK